MLLPQNRGLLLTRGTGISFWNFHSWLILTGLHLNFAIVHHPMSRQVWTPGNQKLLQSPTSSNPFGVLVPRSTTPTSPLFSVQMETSARISMNPEAHMAD